MGEVELLLRRIDDRLEGIESQLARLGHDRSNVTDLWLTKKQLAERVGVSVRWLEDRMREGLPHREIAGKRVFQIAAVESWLRKRGHMREKG